MADDQGVIFVEDIGIVPERLFESGPQGLVVLIPRHQAQSAEDPAGVGIDDEHRATEGIEKNVIGRFGSDAVQADERIPQPPGRPATQA